MKPNTFTASTLLAVSVRCSRRLPAAAARVALATDCKGPELKHYLSLLNIDAFIEVMACGDDVEHGKPDPAF